MWIHNAVVMMQQCQAIHVVADIISLLLVGEERVPTRSYCQICCMVVMNQAAFLPVSLNYPIDELHIGDHADLLAETS